MGVRLFAIFQFFFIDSVDGCKIFCELLQFMGLVVWSLSYRYTILVTVVTADMMV
uniref:Uncharacterized protein n=1 Tax=Picea sitchensis TaxID=3332 RepID=D5ABB0_PICSI|nr:unknown [Picea sitchensis]